MENRPKDEALLLGLCAALALLAAGLGGSLGLSAGFVEAQAASRHLPPVVWEWLTALGDERVLLALILPFCWRHPRLFWAVMAAALIAGLVCSSIHHSLPLPRPAAAMPPGKITVIGQRLSKHSMPSGHSASLFAFAGILLLALGRRLAWPALAMAALAGFSRIAVGAHWPLDVLVGASIGLLAAWLGMKAARRWDWGLRPASFKFLVGIAVVAVITLPFDGQAYPESLPLRLIMCAWGLSGMLLPQLQRLRKPVHIRD